MGLGMIYVHSRPLEPQSTRAEFICDLQEVLMMINKTLSSKIKGFSIIQRRTVFLQEQSVTNTICWENRKNCMIAPQKLYSKQTSKDFIRSIFRAQGKPQIADKRK